MSTIRIYTNFENFSHTESHIIKKGLQHLRCNPLILLVRPAGFEPAAYGFEDRTSEFPNRLKLL